MSLVSSASRWLKTDLWVQDMRLRDRLLKETDLTLEKAVSRASDTSKFQLKELEGGTCIVEGLVPDKRHIYMQQKYPAIEARRQQIIEIVNAVQRCIYDYDYDDSGEGLYIAGNSSRMEDGSDWTELLEHVNDHGQLQVR